MMMSMAKNTPATKKSLQTVPVVTSHGNPAKGTYSAVIVSGSLGPILRIEGSPGSWYLSTLLGVDHFSKVTGREMGAVSDRIAIDFGQDWYLENGRALVTEALGMLLADGKAVA